MRIETEKRALQAVIALGCLVPLLAGGAGMAHGPSILRGVSAGPVAIDLDSHFRYLSGLLFGLGVGFLSCIPALEAKGARLRLLGAVAIIGGLARLGSLIAVGPPGIEHRLALGMELGVVTLLMVWQARLARRWPRATARD
jgi:Domain of unknown function (DUF4345)